MTHNLAFYELIPHWCVLFYHYLGNSTHNSSDAGADEQPNCRYHFPFSGSDGNYEDDDLVNGNKDIHRLMSENVFKIGIIEFLQ